MNEHTDGLPISIMTQHRFHPENRDGFNLPHLRMTDTEGEPPHGENEIVVPASKNIEACALYPPKARHLGHGRWHGLMCLLLLLVARCSLLARSAGARPAREAARCFESQGFGQRPCALPRWLDASSKDPFRFGRGLCLERQPWANEQLDVGHGKIENVQV